MTHATKAIFFWLLSDYIKVKLIHLVMVLMSSFLQVSNISTDQMLYTEADLEAAMDKIETINFHEEKVKPIRTHDMISFFVNLQEVGGIKFWCYNAGHVLGAAMFMIEIAGVKILYTGDFR